MTDFLKLSLELSLLLQHGRYGEVICFHRRTIHLAVCGDHILARSLSSCWLWKPEPETWTREELRRWLAAVSQSSLPRIIFILYSSISPRLIPVLTPSQRMRGRGKTSFSIKYHVTIVFQLFSSLSSFISVEVEPVSLKYLWLHLKFLLLAGKIY